MEYQKISIDDMNYLKYMIKEYNLDIESIKLITEFSGIFLTHNSYIEQDLTFRVMATYVTKKGEKTKKKQLFSWGLKKAQSDGKEKSFEVKNDFEKFVLVFSQIKHFEEIKSIEVKKEELQAKKNYVLS